MPVYEYECEECKHVNERTHSIKDIITKLKCDKCEKLAKVKRLISTTSFVLKGGGWFKDGY